jgi:hypothetical protein
VASEAVPNSRTSCGRGLGDRLVYSNGIILLALFAIALIVAFQANVSSIIQLYIIGVFVSFTLSQLGMVRHWQRELTGGIPSSSRMRIRRAQAIDAIGATFTAIVLIIVLITKFTHGAWIVTIAMPLLFVTMQGIRRHYDRVAAEIAPTPAGVSLPSRIHAIVPVSRLLLPTLQALAFARATHPSTLTAVTVQVDEQETQALADEWRAQEIPVELKVLNSPYREVSTPILDYIRDIRRDSPRDAVCVFIPEYVVGHWWEQLLHNQSALRRRDPQSDLLHQRHRVHQRPLPAGRAGPRPLPQRTSRAEMSLPHHPIARPNRQWQGTMGHEVEAGPQRVRSHIRGPYPNKMITDQIRSTVYLIDPFAGPQGEARVRCAPLSLDSVG